MSDSRITKIMSKSLEHFDKNPKGHFVLQRNRTSWGLPPGAQLYKAAKVAIAEGTSFDAYSRHDLPKDTRTGRENGTSVPPINPHGGMVGRGPYTTYRANPSPRGNNPKDRYAVLKKPQRGEKREGNLSGTRSLPNDSTQDPPKDSRRIGSAPGNKKQPKSQTHQPLPKVNNLVRAKLDEPESSRRGPAGQPSTQTQGVKLEKLGDANHAKSMQEWEMVRADNKSQPESKSAKRKEEPTSNSSYHAKPRDTSLDNADIPLENISGPPDTSRVIVMGSKQKRTSQRNRREAERDEQIRRQLQLRREDQRKNESLNLTMQRKNTTFYRSGYSSDGSPSPRGGNAPRREKTRTQVKRLKSELITRAKTKDYIRERNMKHFVAMHADPKQRDNVDLELYRIEQQMHIYLQTKGMDVNTSDFSKLRPHSRNNTTLNTTARSNTTLKSAKSSRKSARKGYPFVDSKRHVPPWHRKEYVLNKREADMYQKINQVYRNDRLRENRETAFLKKVEALQVEEWKRLWNQYERKLRERDEKRALQQRQLQDVRQKYSDDRWERIARFPVNRIVVRDEADRHEYGLPGDLNEEPFEYAPRTGAEKKPKEIFDSEEHANKNKRRYDPIFDVYRQMNARKRRPKMEGVDVFVIEDEKAQGKGKKRRVGVKDLVREAEDAIDNSDDSEWEDVEDSSTGADGRGGVGRGAGVRGAMSDRGPTGTRYGHSNAPMVKARTSYGNSSFNRSKVGREGGLRFDPKYGAYGSRVNPKDSGGNRQTGLNRSANRPTGSGAQAERLNESGLHKRNQGRYRSNIADFRTGGVAPKPSQGEARRGKGQRQDYKGDQSNAKDDTDNGDPEPYVIGSIPMDTSFKVALINKNSDSTVTFGTSSQLQNKDTRSKDSIKSKGSGSEIEKQGLGGPTVSSKENISNSVGPPQAESANKESSTSTQSKHHISGSDKSSVHNNTGAMDTSGHSSTNNTHSTAQSVSQDGKGTGKEQPGKNAKDPGERDGAGQSNKHSVDTNDQANTSSDKIPAAEKPQKNMNLKGSKLALKDKKEKSVISKRNTADRKNSKAGKSGGKADFSGGSKLNSDSHDNKQPTSEERQESNSHDNRQGQVNGSDNSGNASNISGENQNNKNKVGNSAGGKNDAGEAQQSGKLKPGAKNTGKAGTSIAGSSGQPDGGLNSDSDYSASTQQGGGSQPANNSTTNKSILVSSTTESMVNDNNNPNVSGGSDKENQKPKQTKTVRIVSPEKPAKKAPTRAQSPGLGRHRGDYQEPKAFEIQKSERKTTRAQSPKLFQKGMYKEPKKFEVQKSNKELTKAVAPTLGEGVWHAPDAYEIQTTKRSTRPVSPQFGKGEYTAPKAFEPAKRERSTTRARSPVFAQRKPYEREDYDDYARRSGPNDSRTRDYDDTGNDRSYGRRDHKAPPSEARKPTRKIHKETTETKTIRRRRGGGDDDDDIPDTQRRITRRKTPPKRERAPPRRVAAPERTQDPQRPDIPSPELATDTEDEDDDIFERAKRKYGIVLDDSD